MEPAVLFSMVMLMISSTRPSAPDVRKSEILVTVTPAATGRQLVRFSLPFPRGLVQEGQILLASDGRQDEVAALRPLTWHPVADKTPKSVRRAIVTFPYTFVSNAPVQFTLRPTHRARDIATPFPVDVRLDGETVMLTYQDGTILRARLLAPVRTSSETPRTETVESNAYFLWQRTQLPDSQWPRIIEVRVDALGGVVVVAHLQRNQPDNGRTPDFGWEISTRSSHSLLSDGEDIVVTQETKSHTFADDKPCKLLFEDNRYYLHHPTASFKQRGRVEVHKEDENRLVYRYWRCTAEEKVPMQQAAWRRAEFVVTPANMAPLTATLESPHTVQVDWQLWDELYDTEQPLNLKELPELAELLCYHHDAIVRSMAHGDDWGNVTSYSDNEATGAVFGMNRLNHCPAIFEEAFRSDDRRLLETAVLWCDNFYDQSIWWGPDATGGTRYNNLIAMGRTPPDDDRSYMWRSNSAVNFCTKGYDTFFLAYEQTGDPRMMEALEAQVRYSAEHLHADQGECRNIGDVRDFVRLYQFTGQGHYLDEVLRLFRELRTKLSADDLFSQGGRPIVPDPPFIDDDQIGYRHPFAKPYIIGYALAGLPELARYAPDEPKLRDVVQAVADFLAESQDPIGGWRYPHPRSSGVSMSQAIEHAWQLVQADKLLGARSTSTQ